MAKIEKCGCGKPLHYPETEEGCKLKHMIQAFCHTLGKNVKVTTSAGSWMVPRHYIALHGLRAIDLPEIAKLRGFEKVEEDERRS
jgi:hypothetical protein